MKTKNLVGILLLFLSFTSLISCDKEDSTPEQSQELKISVADEIVYTDDLEYSFDIVSGKGGYQVTVENDNSFSSPAKVTMTGHHVKVDLFTERVGLIITDQTNQTIRLSIVSSNNALQIQNYEVGLSYGAIMKTEISFGIGKHSILKSSGTSAEAYFETNHMIVIKSLKPGISGFLITDERGTTNGMTVRVYNGYDLTSDKLTVTTAGNQYLTFPIKYGEGNWRITSPLLNDPQFCVMPKSENYEQDMLQVFVAKEPMVITLKDKADNEATITIQVKPSE